MPSDRTHLPSETPPATGESLTTSLAVEDPALARTMATPGETTGTTLRRGAAVGRYVILDQLGEGGMGVVYTAYDPELDRKVAVKLLRSHAQGATDHEGRARLLREGQAMARLSHPNVMAVHDVGTYEGEVFIAMELVEGGTLRDWLKTRTDWREIVAMFVQAGRGLAAAHDAGLVHRDFKGDNVLVGRDGRAQVLDFGLAYAAEGRVKNPGSVPPPARATNRLTSLQTPLTEDGRVLGTPRYMAPEQLSGERTDASADQFSFCVALFEGLYGEPPFEGDDLRTLASNVQSGRIRPMRGARRVPSRVRQILVRGLSVDPADRYPSIRALLRDLEHDPAIARRRRLVAGGASLTAAGLLAATLYSVQERRTVCTSASDAVVHVWNPGAARVLRAAFAAAGKTYLDTVTNNVIAGMDTYAGQVAADLVETCHESRVTRELSNDQAEARRDCLLGRASELHALDERLRTGGTAALADALHLAGELSDVSECRDPKRAALIPSDPAQRDAVRAIRAKLDDVTNRAILGQFEEGANLARGAIDAAKAVGYRPVQAEAEYRMGNAEVRLGNYADAEAFLRQALLDADACRDDLLRVRVAIELIAVSGDQQTRSEEGLKWGVAARATLERIGGDAALEGALENHLGRVFWNLARYDEAVAAFDRSIQLRERLGDKIEVAGTLNNKAVVLWDQGTLRSALDVILQVEKAFAELIGELHPTFALILENEGNLWVDLGRPDRAATVQEHVRAIRAQALPADHPQQAQTLLSIGDALAGMGDLDGANRALREGMAMLGTRGNVSVDIIGGFQRALGRNEQRRGNARESESILREALATFAKGYDTNHPEYARTLLRVAATELDAGRPDDAARDAEAARKTLEAVPNGDKADLAEAWETRAEARGARGDRAAALDGYERAVALLGPHRSERAAEYAIALLRADALGLALGRVPPEMATHAAEAIGSVADMTSVEARFARAYAVAVRDHASALAGRSEGMDELRRANEELGKVVYVNRAAAAEALAWSGVRGR